MILNLPQETLRLMAQSRASYVQRSQLMPSQTYDFLYEILVYSSSSIYSFFFATSTEVCVAVFPEFQVSNNVSGMDVNTVIIEI